MKGQISIFDWMPEAVPAMTFPDIKDIHEAEAVGKAERRTDG